MDFNARVFGAVGDGVEKDTKAIQTAIDTCSREGGGRVVISKGTFLTGTLFMKSKVELHVEINAILLGSGDITDYATDTHKQLYRNEGHMDKCLIYSNLADDIAFTGRGTIHGQGDRFPSSGPRPFLLRFLNCQNIRLNGLRLRNPAAWTSAFICCDDIWVDGIDILSRSNFNGDGLDFDCCQNVFVSNSKLDCSDDCICLQNSEPGKKCMNIVVTNTMMRSQWAGLRIGLLSCGDIENVTVTNCIFRDIHCSALKIQSAEGSTLQNMVFANLIMENVQRPLFLTLNQYRERVDMPDDIPQKSQLKDMLFDNIRAVGKIDDEKYLRSCMIIDGLPGCRIENISLSNISYTAVGGGTLEDAARTDIPHHFNIRAECFNYMGSLPAFGLYARHVKGLKLHNVNIDTMKTDERMMAFLDDCL